MSVYSAPRTFFHRIWHEPAPSLGIEFSAEGVAAARWTPGQGTIERFDSEPLEEGALRPSPVRENLARPEDVRRAAAAALQRVARRSTGNLAVFLPDVAARVSVLSVDRFPEKPDEALPFIRWRLKKAVPFDVDDASIAYQRQGASAAGLEVMVAAAPRVVVRQYETLLESLGYQPGFVTVSSLAALGLIARNETFGSGTMLIRNSGRLLTIVATGDDKLRIFRSTELPAGEQARSAEEITGDVYSSAVYFQDNYGGTVGRVYLAGFGERTPELRDAIERELNVRPQLLVVPGARGEDEAFLGCYGMAAEQAKE